MQTSVTYKTESVPAKTYKIGDYYNENGKEGVVFDVWDGGRHGKIVSLEQEKLQWCTDAHFDKGIVVGASHCIDGKANTDNVMARADSAEYPAFVWCRNFGKDWYLPAKDELKLLLLNDSVHDAVNRTLENRGATQLHNKGELAWCWSSTEFANNEEFCAWLVGMYDGLANDAKDGSYYVRAVARF